jgi:hypothetical protein
MTFRLLDLSSRLDTIGLTDTYLSFEADPAVQTRCMVMTPLSGLSLQPRPLRPRYHILMS